MRSIQLARPDWIFHKDTPVAVCIYGAVARAFPAAWNSQKLYVIEPLRRYFNRVEVYIFEQVDACFDEQQAPTNCREIIESEVTAYHAITTETIDAAVASHCSQSCAHFGHGNEYAYRFAYLEHLVSEFLKTFEGIAVAFSGDFVFARTIDPSEILELKCNEIMFADRFYYTMHEQDRKYNGAEPDGLYSGCSSSVANVMNTFENIHNRHDNYYEHQIGQNLRDNALVPKHSASIRTEKLRRTGKYKYSLDDERIVGSDSLEETRHLRDIYMKIAEQIPSNKPC